MDLSEFQYLMNKGYITDVTYAETVLDNYYNGDKSMMKNLTEVQLVEMNLISQPGYVAGVHTFTINPTPTDAKVTMRYNGMTLEQNIVIVKHGTEVSWSVEKEGFTTQENTENIEQDDTRDIVLVAVGGEDDLEAAQAEPMMAMQAAPAMAEPAEEPVVEEKVEETKTETIEPVVESVEPAVEETKTETIEPVAEPAAAVVEEKVTEPVAEVTEEVKPAKTTKTKTK